MNRSPTELAEQKHSLACRITPHGAIAVSAIPLDAAAAGALPHSAVEQIIRAFAAGRGMGLLQLALAQLRRQLPPPLAYWRDIGQTFIGSVCAGLDPSKPEQLVLPEANPEDLADWLAILPPMPGAEMLSTALLGEIWQDIGEALASEVRGYQGDVQAYLAAHHSAWNVVGRVCLHLAENKRDPDYPFAFIATYVERLSRQAKPVHLPLAQALREYAGAKNLQKLLGLLAPLSRASEHSQFIRELVESKGIYQSLAWTAQEAHQLLLETEACERAGLVVRLPDWWNPRHKPRPQITLSFGEDKPAHLGQKALLDFDIQLTLGGERLSPEEIAQLLEDSDPLRMMKGQWVEVDREKLQQVLEHWRKIQGQVGQNFSFAKAMRLLAGVQDELGAEDFGEDAPEWSEVIAGKWLREKLEILRSPQQAQLRSAVQTGAGLRAELRPYQKLGIEWLLCLHSLELGGCLADDMGLGKTIQVLGALSVIRQASRENALNNASNDAPKGKETKKGKKKKGTGDAIVDLLVVPASLMGNWEQEIQRFAPQLKALLAHPSRIATAQLKGYTWQDVCAYDLVITSYGTLMRNPQLQEMPWHGLILDEAQAIKNPGTKQTRAVKATQGRWRLALTGTPVENQLNDLWSIFDFINPGLLGGLTAFGQFCKGLNEGKQGYAPLRKLVQPYILRRLKTDKSVIADLPDKTEVNAYCFLSKKQGALYQQAITEMQSVLEQVKGMERRGVVLAYLLRLKQICNHPSQWLGDESYREKDSGKLGQLRQLCQAIASRQDKVLIFSQFRQITAPLASFLNQVFAAEGGLGTGLVLHGGTPVKQRQKLVQQFQQDDAVPFMVLSLKAGGTGLNLTAASHVIHFDRWWNPAIENQATDRVFRIGQKKNVLVHKFVCRGTIEERIDQMLTDKQRLSEEILQGGGESALTELSNEELMSMVSLDLNSVQ